MLFRLSLGVALALSTPVCAQGITPGKEQLDSFKQWDGEFHGFSENRIDTVEHALVDAVKQGGLDGAARYLSQHHGLSAQVSKRLAGLLVMVRAIPYNHDESQMKPLHQEALALIPLVRSSPTALMLLASALGEMHKCDGGDFEALMAGSTQPVRGAYTIAASTTCQGNFARAARVAGHEAMPVLIRWAGWGVLSHGDELAIYDWLTSDDALAHVAPADRAGMEVYLWRLYLEALLNTGLPSKALERLEAMPAALRERVLAPDAAMPGLVTVDGISMQIATTQSTPYALARQKSDFAPPLVGLAEALAVASRKDEARSMLARIPAWPQIHALMACLSTTQTSDATKACASLAGAAKAADMVDLEHQLNALLVLDQGLERPGDDPYLVAETIEGANPGAESPSGAALRCMLLRAPQFPTACPEGRAAAAPDLNDKDGYEDQKVAREALAAVLPGYADRRGALMALAPAAVNHESWPSRPTHIAQAPDYHEQPLPPAMHGEGSDVPVKGLAPLPRGFRLLRAERAGQRVVAISLSQTFDPVGEVGGGGYWVHVSGDGGRHWGKPLYTGLADRWPYVVKAGSPMPLIAGDALHLAVDIAELDTASISYPPVAIRARREAKDLYLTLPLADLARDSDGDGITDIAAHHLLLDRADGAFVVGKGQGADCGQPLTAERKAFIALLGRLVDPARAAIVEPINRPVGVLMLGKADADAAPMSPLFIKGDRKDFVCLRSGRPIIVYDDAAMVAMAPLSPDFHTMEVPAITFNRAHDQGYVRWSNGWAGGTYRLRLVKGEWVFDSIRQWIS